MIERKGKRPQSPILVVDDEEHAIKSFELTLRSGGFNNVVPCPDSLKVNELLEQGEFELILLDLVMPERSGEEILSDVVKRFPEIPVIMVTGTNEVETAVRCMQKGAFDYVLKPVEKERLLPSIHRALEVRHLRRENAELARRFFSEDLDQPEIFSGIITRSRKMMAVFRYCEAIAAGRHPILITGETGSGKELVAEALHKIGGGSGEFVAVNVAGLDDTMFSDTLFGHLRGAFTGAAQVRSGQIEMAAGGTLFLDEIGDLGLTSQVKLLRLLDQHEYFPLGSDVAKLTDARFVFATNTDLFSLTREGKFREDLLYRLRTHHVQLPPLRERLDDIPLLLAYFIDEAAREFGKIPPSYTQGIVAMLQNYHFPGNVRELKSLVFDAVSRGESNTLSMRSFEDAIQAGRTTPVSSIRRQAPSGASWLTELEQLPTIKEATETLIQEALNRANNNQRVAAMTLGITPQALNQRLKRQS